MMSDALVPRKPTRQFWPLPPIAPPQVEPVLPVAAVDGLGALRPLIQRILVLKLDDVEDFAGGLLALRALRDTFPSATVRLVCGTRHEASAIACGVADEVRCCSQPHDPGASEQYARAVEGRFDLAIDLCVNADSRHWLTRVSAAVRCGIGSRLRFPFLDIALADERGCAAQCVYLSPGQFNSSLPVKGAMHHYGPLVAGDIVRGPRVVLPTGQLRAELRLTVRGHLPGVMPYAVHVEVARDDGSVVCRQMFGRGTMLRLRRQPVALEFENLATQPECEFRVYVTGRPSRGTVAFSGVTVSKADGGPVVPVRARDLLIGEKLILLIALIQARIAPGAA